MMGAISPPSKYSVRVFKGFSYQGWKKEREVVHAALITKQKGPQQEGKQQHEAGNGL